MADEEERNGNYFSIEEIVSEQELVPVVFQSKVTFSEQIFPTQHPIYSSSQSQQSQMSQSQQQQSQEDDFTSTNTSSTNGTDTQQTIKANTRMYLPYWLAAILQDQGHITSDMPKCFKDSIDILDADPTTCNLRGLNKYYFIHGSQVAELLSGSGTTEKEQSGDKLSQIITLAFKKRFVKLLNEANSSNFSKSDYSEITRKLTATELSIFEAAREGAEEFQSYKSTAGYDRMNSFSKASLWTNSASSDTFNAKEFYHRTRQLEEEQKEQEERHDRYRKRPNQQQQQQTNGSN
jgi:hypothetical protein